MTSFLSVMRVISAITAVLVAVSPAPDFWKIYKTRSTGLFSILPVVMIFCNCYVWVLYAYFVDNILPLFVNCVFGMLTSIVFGGIYYRWSNDRPRVHKLCAIAFVVLALYTVYYILGTSGVTNQSDDSVEKVLGVLSDIVSLVLYASPLETMKQVIQTKDATTLPIIISAIFLTNTTVWTIFSIADEDMFVLVPNAIGMLVCIAQVVLYIMYPPGNTKANHIDSEDEVKTPKACEDLTSEYVALKEASAV
ncbi:MtN3-like protein [Phytophthora palmivora]|uniref:Sugar transporter SWEET1 n=1 Tax=Phytophthora palmivora TaxID=4796 RepID=A0A2P4XMH4_9STRA|nr:MtN3-like protein [Phytophthora palmivora]